jgi:hypothetical protein
VLFATSLQTLPVLCSCCVLLRTLYTWGFHLIMLEGRKKIPPLFDIVLSVLNAVYGLCSCSDRRPAVDEVATRECIVLVSWLLCQWSLSCSWRVRRAAYVYHLKSVHDTLKDSYDSTQFASIRLQVKKNPRANRPKAESTNQRNDSHFRHKKTFSWMGKGLNWRFDFPFYQLLTTYRS